MITWICLVYLGCQVRIMFSWSKNRWAFWQTLYCWWRLLASGGSLDSETGSTDCLVALFYSMPCIRQLQLYPAQRMSAHTWHQNNPSTRKRPQNRHSKVTRWRPYKRYVYAAWFEKCIITTFCSFDNSVTYQKMVCVAIKCSVLFSNVKA